MFNNTKAQYEDVKKILGCDPRSTRDIILHPDDPGIETQEFDRHCQQAQRGSRALRIAILDVHYG